MVETIHPIAPADRDAVVSRLRRIEGQVRGIQRMVEEGQDCRKIVHQMAAVRAALNSLNGLVLECYAHGCLEDTENLCDETLAELINMMMKSAR